MVVIHTAVNALLGHIQTNKPLPVPHVPLAHIHPQLYLVLVCHAAAGPSALQWGAPKNAVCVHLETIALMPMHYLFLVVWACLVPLA